MEYFTDLVKLFRQFGNSTLRHEIIHFIATSEFYNLSGLEKLLCTPGIILTKDIILTFNINVLHRTLRELTKNKSISNTNSKIRSDNVDSTLERC